MNDNKLFEDRVQRLRDATIIAIFRVQAAEHAVEGIGAAVRGGFEAVEITMNSPGALEALTEVAGRTDAIAGVGTVLEADQVKEAYDAGAEFIVTPTVNIDVIEAAHALSLPVCMGASTPTEIYKAHKAGADWVKVFPAEQLGGPDYIANVLGPLDDVNILVTGGITGENYLGYLDAGAQLVGFANAVFDSTIAAEGRYEEFERRSVEINRRLDLYLTERDDD
jgi:2-dehydro-3-deoxyphosphogluconate aldolase / (4S)-4-hydroxy-2-oxoglutarate aldolase